MRGSFKSGFTERLLPGGEGVVRTTSGTVLVPNTVPGDHVDISVVDRRRGAWRGKICKVKNSSEDRVSSASCSTAGSCGGCALQYVRTEYQAMIKNEWVRNAFAPFLSNQVQFSGITVEEVILGSRRRMRWWRGEDKSGIYWGFHGRATHEVSRQNVCLAATTRIRELHAQFDRLPLSGVKSIQVTELDDGIHLVLEGDCINLPSVLPDSISGMPVQYWGRSTTMGTYPLTRPVIELHDRLPSGEEWLELSVGPDDFIQSNKLGNEIMIRQVVDWCVGARRIADMFSGIGNLSLPIAAALNTEVVGAEVRRTSVVAANKTGHSLGLNAHYKETDLFHEFDLAPFTGTDILILDPPRKGAIHVCKKLPVLLPRKIILISCDIASGNRDAEVIARHGYHLRKVRALDMFPFTGHVEAISLWEM